MVQHASALAQQPFKARLFGEGPNLDGERGRGVPYAQGRGLPQVDLIQKSPVQHLVAFGGRPVLVERRIPPRFRRSRLNRAKGRENNKSYVTLIWGVYPFFDHFHPVADSAPKVQVPPTSMILRGKPPALFGLNRRQGHLRGPHEGVFRTPYQSDTLGRAFEMAHEGW